MSLKIKDKIVEFLNSNKEDKFTGKEIADWIFENYPNECKAKMGKSKASETEADLLIQLRAEIASVGNSIDRMKITSERPRKYYFSDLTDEEEIKTIEISKDNEASLYPMLNKYLKSIGVYGKRINEKRSKNKQGPKGNHWLFMDVVGLEPLINSWDDRTKSLASTINSKMAKLWSFEVKSALNKSNLRESFFQTVSNSSWANLGYLVSGELDGKIYEELRMLCALHGIGFILLNKETPEESQVQIPARENVDIDFSSLDRVLKENDDFKDFVKLVEEFYRNKEIKYFEWEQKM
jgi:uncharacterized protein